MAYQLSPGVLLQERDISGIIPAVSSSRGAFVGQFTWGPVEDPVIVSDEDQLVQIFGQPPSDAQQAAWFWSAANFLAYSNALFNVRVVQQGARNASVDGELESLLIKNSTQFDGMASFPAVGEFCAKYPGVLGNSILISYADQATFAAWEYRSLFGYAPGTTDWVADRDASQDEMHVVIIDAGGSITGTAGTILERFEGVSKADGAIRFDGQSNYYVDVINQRSAYVWALDVPAATNWGTSAAEDKEYDLTEDAFEERLQYGNDGTAITTSELQTGWDIFENAETYDVNLLITGPAEGADGAYVSEIAVKRRDAIAFLSPPLAAVTGVDKRTAVVSWRDGLNVNTSYAVLDSGWKYQYDRYNRRYVWVPLNADIAGLCAYTDEIRDPWWSPAGFNRGFVKNVVKLAYSPSEADRDTLYPLGVNPVVTFPGEGTILYGDKTAQRKPSAFDRINVRRLFIVVGKAVSTAAKYQLFQFNDEYTRANFRAMVEPYLAEIKGRRGITDFMVRCDSTNNTPEVIDRNEFVAEIYIKPARSINFVKLTLVATRTGVEFSETIGQ
jgi:hypothetical protein